MERTMTAFLETNLLEALKSLTKVVSSSCLQVAMSVYWFAGETASKCKNRPTLAVQTMQSL